MKTNSLMEAILMNQKWDVGVIGGGAAGLVTAILLAQSGKSVVLLEKGKKVGGRAVSSQEKGAIFNLGPHALYKNNAAQRVLESLESFPKGSSPKPNIHWLFSNKELVSSARLLFGRRFNWYEKRQLISFIINLRKMDVEKLAGISWRDHLTNMGISGEGRSLLEAMGRLTTYGGNPDQLDAGLTISQLQKSIIYPDYGWQTIVDRLVKKAKEVGVQLILDAGVTGVQRKEGEGWSIVTKHDLYQVEQVVVATNPTQMFTWFEQWLPNAYKQQLGQLENLTVSCLDLHLRKLPFPSRTFALGTNEPLYLSVHSQWAKLTESSSAVVHVMRYDNGKDNDQELIKETLEEFLDLVQPGWREEVIFQRYIPRLIVSHASPTPTIKGTLDRPDVYTGIPGVFAVGDWVGQEGILLDASMASAEEVAKRINSNLVEQGWMNHGSRSSIPYNSVV